MFGPEGVQRVVAQRLRDRLPGKLAEMRVRYDVDTRTLPTPAPANIHAHAVDIVTIGQFPSIMVTTRDNVGRTIGTRVTETTGDYDEYEYRYRVRVWMFVTGDDYGPTDVARLRMMLAIREILIRERLLWESGGESVAVDDLAIREELEEGLAQDRVGKLLGEAVLEFEAKTVERLNLGPNPVVDIEQTVTGGIHPYDLD